MSDAEKRGVTMKEKDIVIYGEEIDSEGNSTTTEFPSVTEEKKETKKRSLFRKKKVTAVPESVAEKAETVRVYEESVVDETVSAEDTQELATQPIKLGTDELEKTQIIAVEEEEESAQEGGQLLLDGFDGNTVSDNSLGTEERLRQVRREKIQDFSQKREQHIREDLAAQEASQKEADVVYPDAPETGEEPVTEETIETVEEEKGKLREATRQINVSFFFTAVFEIVLFLITIFSAFSTALSASPVTYTLFQIVLLCLLVGFNFKPLWHGVTRLFSGAPTVASGVALSAMAALLHTVLQFLNPEGVMNGTASFVTVISGFAVLLFAVGRSIENERHNRNQNMIALEEQEKTVYKTIDDPILAEEIGRPALAIGIPHVAYYRKTQNVTSFLKMSQDDEVCVKQLKWYLPVLLFLSLLVSLVFFFTTSLSSWYTAIGAFCAMIAAGAPSLLFLGLEIAINRAALTTAKEGTALLGYRTVETYGTVHALALDAMDLFPEHSVLLHGIKTFSGTRIDDAILDAASVSVRAGGPLSHVFRRMIQNKVGMLREVDTLVYEQDMGLSGWVNGRRVLIGNRKLLDNHGIDIPSKDYEDRYAQNGRQLVYLSIAGELSAMFVVSYVADPVVKEMLTKLTKQHITMLVRTCDQNITERLIAEVFGLNGFYVEVLNAPAGRSFEGLVEEVTESESTGMISDGRRNGLILALAMCHRLRNGMTFFTVLQILAAVAVIVMVAVTAFATEKLLSPVYLLFCLLCACVTTLLGALLYGRK